MPKTEEKKPEEKKPEEKKPEAKPAKKQSLKDGKAEFEKALKGAMKMRRTNKLNAIANAIGTFARNHGVKEANEMHKEHNLAGEGIHRISEPKK